MVNPLSDYWVCALWKNRITTVMSKTTVSLLMLQGIRNIDIQNLQ